MANVSFSLSEEGLQKMTNVRDLMDEQFPKVIGAIEHMAEHATKSGLESYIRDAGTLREAYSEDTVKAGRQLVEAMTAYIDMYKRVASFQQ